MKRSFLTYAVSMDIGAGLRASSLWVCSSYNRPETAHFRPSHYRSRGADLSPAKRVMKKAQARRKGGAA